MGVTTALLVVGATIVFVILKWWFSASGQLYRDKSIPVPSGKIAYIFINDLIVGTYYLLF